MKNPLENLLGGIKKNVGKAAIGAAAIVGMTEMANSQVPVNINELKGKPPIEVFKAFGYGTDIAMIEAFLYEKGYIQDMSILEKKITDEGFPSPELYTDGAGNVHSAYGELLPRTAEANIAVANIFLAPENSKVLGELKTAFWNDFKPAYDKKMAEKKANMEKEVAEKYASGEWTRLTDEDPK